MSEQVPGYELGSLLSQEVVSCITAPGQPLCFPSPRISTTEVTDFFLERQLRSTGSESRKTTVLQDLIHDVDENDDDDDDDDGDDFITLEENPRLLENCPV